MLLRDTLSSMLSTAIASKLLKRWTNGCKVPEILLRAMCYCVNGTRVIRCQQRNGTLVSASRLLVVAETSAILLLNASKLLAIVGNGTQPLLPLIQTKGFRSDKESGD